MKRLDQIKFKKIEKIKKVVKVGKKIEVIVEGQFHEESKIAKLTRLIKIGKFETVQYFAEIDSKEVAIEINWHSELDHTYTFCARPLKVKSFNSGFSKMIQDSRGETR